MLGSGLLYVRHKQRRKWDSLPRRLRSAAKRPPVSIAFDILLLLVCEASAVGKEVPGSIPGWLRIKLWATFLHHTDRGQGR